MTNALLPVVQALEATGDINGKHLEQYRLSDQLVSGEMKALLGDEQVTALRQHCFFESSLPMAVTIRCGER